MPHGASSRNDQTMQTADGRRCSFPTLNLPAGHFLLMAPTATIL